MRKEDRVRVQAAEGHLQAEESGAAQPLDLGLQNCEETRFCCGSPSVVLGYCSACKPVLSPTLWPPWPFLCPSLPRPGPQAQPGALTQALPTAGDARGHADPLPAPGLLGRFAPPGARGQRQPRIPWTVRLELAPLLQTRSTHPVRKEPRRHIRLDGQRLK